MRPSAALKLATEIYGDMSEPDGGLAIMHPIAVASLLARMRQNSDYDDLFALSLFHDMYEDIGESAAMHLVSEDVPTDVLHAMTVITREPGLPYDAYIARLCDYPGRAGFLARIVKLFDLKANMSRPNYRRRLRERHMSAFDSIVDALIVRDGIVPLLIP